MTPRYNDYASHMRRRFGGLVQKLSINAGFTCPNRDGSKGRGGCTYCNNRSFSPRYCAPNLSVTEQLEQGKLRTRRNRRASVGYLAYFQSYTNTYESVETLERLYHEALAVDGILGLAISTRPDCVSAEILDLLERLAREKYVALDFGVESCCDATLRRIHRGHTFADSQRALRFSADRGIELGAHLILGLPGEGREAMLGHADELSALPLLKIKLHQLQIVRGTRMANEYERTPEAFSLLGHAAYVDLVSDFLERLRADLIIERLAGETATDMLIAPHWGIRSADVGLYVTRELERRDTTQGSRCSAS